MKDLITKIIDFSVDKIFTIFIIIVLITINGLLYKMYKEYRAYKNGVLFSRYGVLREIIIDKQGIAFPKDHEVFITIIKIHPREYKLIITDCE